MPLPLEQLLKLQIRAGSRLAQHLGEAPGAVFVLTAVDLRALCTGASLAIVKRLGAHYGGSRWVEGML